MTRIEHIRKSIATYNPQADLDLVGKAYDFASRAHEGQTRRSGDPYVTHPLSVAFIITQLKLDVPSVCAGLLHDAVEDTSVTVEELTREFGSEIAFLVDGVTKLGQLPFSTREERQAENFRKMLLAMAKDIRVILVKFCDRLDNMRTLGHLPPAKQERIASETLQIYAPLANRLGIQWIKTELEDLCFKYLHPGEHEQLKNAITKTRRERERYTREVEALIQSEMSSAKVRCEVSGRAKHLYSIRQKMRRTGRSFEEIHDTIGFRVITQSVRECYEALGVTHSVWKPIPGRFKDYIALPKPNMYQSLHTAVIGPHGERIEIQIRTEDMHLVAEQGIAAHWKYKEGKSPVTAGDTEKFTWLRRMMESQKDLSDPSEFIESVKMNLFGDEVYVFTPGGDVKELPKGSCPIDFAYSIHSEVGDHCSGARVNGVIVPLRYQMRNGDTVEIITSPNQKPNKDWLKLVKTSRAKTKIRHCLRKEQRERSSAMGKDLLEKALRKYGASYAKSLKAGQIKQAATELKCHSVEDLLCQLGYGRLSTGDVVDRVIPEEKRKKGVRRKVGETMNPLQKILRRVTRRSSTSGIKVQGEDGILVRIARCCSPLPGDSIVGFITRGRGVTVHTQNCPKALDLDPDRRIEVDWDTSVRAQHQVAIQVLCADKPGLLANISQSFSDSGVNITQAHCRATDDGRAVNTFHANVTDLDQLKTVIRSLSRINGVYSVDRVGTGA
jgi:GTP pyrophosphokinase